MKENVYLFYGEEKYDIEYEVSKLKAKFGELNIGLNFFNITTENIDQLSNISDSYTFFGSGKFILVKNINLKYDFKNVIESLDENSVLVIVETTVDKRTTQYKELSKIANCKEFKKLAPNDLSKYVLKVLSGNNLKIDSNMADYIVSICPDDKYSIINELKKLTLYIKPSSVITKEIIDKVVSKTLNAKLFDMLNDATNKKSKDAIEKLEHLLLQKESIVKIYIMLYRQIFQLYMIKLYKSKNLPNISEDMGIHPYALKTLSITSSNYSLEKLKEIMYMFDKYDEDTKKGEMDFEIGLKKIILNM